MFGYHQNYTFHATLSIPVCNILTLSCYATYSCRIELLVLLKQEGSFRTEADIAAATHNCMDGSVTYETINVDRIAKPDVVDAMLRAYCEDDKYRELFIDLEPYINQSAVCLSGSFSLHRTYIIFRTLGLRHLTIVDSNNHVIGILTRKDLMGFQMEEKLATQLYPPHTQQSTDQSLNYPT